MCTKTRLTPATSASGPGAPTGPTSAPGLGRTALQLGDGLGAHCVLRCADSAHKADEWRIALHDQVQLREGDRLAPDLRVQHAMPACSVQNGMCAVQHATCNSVQQARCNMQQRATGMHRARLGVQTRAVREGGAGAGGSGCPDRPRRSRSQRVRKQRLLCDQALYVSLQKSARADGASARVAELSLMAMARD